MVLWVEVSSYHNPSVLCHLQNKTHMICHRTRHCPLHVTANSQIIIIWLLTVYQSVASAFRSDNAIIITCSLHQLPNKQRIQFKIGLLPPYQHWLCVPDWTTFKLVTMMFQCINVTAPGYLSYVRRVADVPGQKHLRSAASSLLIIPATRRFSVAALAFVIAAVLA